MIKNDKRAISAVITTILLVLIAIVAVLIVYSFVIPMIKEGLGKGKSCFDLIDQVSINLDSGYTCYEDSETDVMIDLGFEENAEIAGLIFSIKKEGSAWRYELSNNTESDPVGVRMCGKTVGKLEIPNPGEARTYVFPKGGIKLVEVAVVLSNGEVCQSISATLDKCEADIC